MDSITGACTLHNAGGMLYVGSGALQGRLLTQSVSLSPLSELPLRAWSLHSKDLTPLYQGKPWGIWQPWTFVAGTLVQRNLDVKLEDPVSGRLMVGTYVGDPLRSSSGAILRAPGLWSQWNAWMQKVLGSGSQDWMAYAAANHFAFKQGGPIQRVTHPPGLNYLEASWGDGLPAPGSVSALGSAALGTLPQDSRHTVPGKGVHDKSSDESHIQKIIHCRI